MIMRSRTKYQVLSSGPYKVINTEIICNAQVVLSVQRIMPHPASDDTDKASV